MLTIDEVLSKKNQNAAMDHLLQKKNGCGIDGMHISDFEEYWNLNKDKICQDIRNKEYKPGLVLIREIINNKGKRRNIASLNVIDRFISRMLSKKLDKYFDPLFCDNSFAYREGKGVPDALNKAKTYIEQGCKYVVEIDIKDYFDNIVLEDLYSLVEQQIKDSAVLYLIHAYLYCDISNDGRINPNLKGVVQGNPISPILSNLYLLELDKLLEEKNLMWIRYADNVYVFTKEYEEALGLFNLISMQIELKGLTLNINKSGVFNIDNKVILGYDLYQTKKGIDIRKHSYKEIKQYSRWHDTNMQFLNGKYHIVSDGIINKSDFSLLFENEEKKCYIPVEVVDQINIFGNVTLASNVLQTLSQHKLKASFFDRYGNMIGTFFPENTKSSSNILIKQCEKYIDETIRIDTARKMEIAGLHNIRANLRYYNKKHKGVFDESIKVIGQYIDGINKADSVEEMLLLEAKAREKYYSMFNYILDNEDFVFTKRTKRPPKDAINALISFGNTLVYNHFLHLLWKKGIDPRFGVIHHSNKRSFSLNLDFADIYKPIIVDRIIFTIVNRRLLTANSDFREYKDGISLNRQGKIEFLKLYEEKLNSKITVDDQMISYRKQMELEVQSYKNFLLEDGKYKPYKYY